MGLAAESEEEERVDRNFLPFSIYAPVLDSSSYLACFTSAASSGQLHSPSHSRICPQTLLGPEYPLHCCPQGILEFLFLSRQSAWIHTKMSFHQIFFELGAIEMDRSTVFKSISTESPNMLKIEATPTPSKLP